jgi:hypothetical protein
MQGIDRSRDDIFYQLALGDVHHGTEQGCRLTFLIQL